MAVEIDATHKILASGATRLFAIPGVLPEWGGTPDGTRFLFAVPLAPPPFNIVQGWRQLVRP